MRVPRLSQPATISRNRLVSILPFAALLIAVASPSRAATDGPRCTVPGDITRLDRPLERIAHRLVLGEPITIVAVGSSSTAGAGASSPAASYPSRLEAELKVRYPNARIRVLNRGVNGEEAKDMLARFDREVIAEKPDLVLWQVGTNSVLRDRTIDEDAPTLRSGIARLKAAGADIVLVDPQFAPKVLEKPDHARMLALIGRTARDTAVAVFHRFAAMRHWHESARIGFEAFVAPDGLHHNDWSYACVAKLIAGSIADAAGRSAVAAHQPVSRN